MAISNNMNDRHTSAADAIANARNAKAAEAIGNQTTARGTIIRKSNTEMDKNSFLKILSAQLTNLDPTSNQDSTAYVTQMAQFTSMEQTANLNDTMTNFANQQLAGKTVILDEKYDDGTYIKGNVKEVIKKSGSTFLKVEVDGKEEEIPIKSIIGVDDTNSNTIANSRTALNSDFIAASALASKNQNVVMSELDKDKKVVLIKGKVTGAYIDTVNSSVVKIKVDVKDADGKSTTKTYNYQDIVSAGDLTEDEMNATISTINANIKAADDAAAAAKAIADAKAAADKKAAEDAKLAQTAGA